jgi:hypothetical protein
MGASAVGPTPEERRQELEIEKLNLEVQMLADERRTSSIRLILTIGGGLVGGATLIWTIIFGLRTISHQVKQRREERVSTLLESLSSELKSKRLGAARGLSRYVEAAIPELLAAAATEHSEEVRLAIEESLARLRGSDMYRITRANADTLPRQMYLLGRLEAIELGA